MATSRQPGILLRIALWELRGSLGRLFYWLLCLTVGTAAVVAIDGLARSLDLAIRSEAKSLLAADLAVSSRQPLSEEVRSAIDSLPGGPSGRLASDVLDRVERPERSAD